MRLRKGSLCLAALLAATAAAPAAAQAAPRYQSGTVIAKAGISSDACQKLLAAALAEAKRRKLSMSIAIVDDGGNLLAFQRMDGAAVGGGTVAQAKARTAAQFRMPTRAIGEMVERIGINMLTTPDMLSLGGGVPLMIDGVMVAAIGASGGTGDEDLAVIAAGLAALQE